MRTIKKITASICLSILIVMSLQAQVIPTSGNAGSISKAGQVPVGLFTGTPQVSIPIHNFSSRNISVPISLNYSSNGVRVDEIESHVGMTWNLAAGGVITRTVFDHPDENGRLPYDPKEKIKFMAEVITKRNFEAYNAKNNDIQQDIFSFSFAGYSGQFFLDDKYQPVLINPSPVKIEMMNYGDPDADQIDFDTSLQGFKIITPDGYAYYFGGVITNYSSQDGQTYYEAVKEGVETTSISIACDGNTTTIRPVKTAWYLNRITNVSTATIAEIFGGITVGPTYQREKEIIRFVYEEKTHTYTTGISESETITYKTTGDDELCGDEVGLQECVNTVTVIESYLKEIIAYDVLPNNQGKSYISGKVTFDYLRQAESYISNREYLDKVKIWDVNNNLLKEVKLDYRIYRSNKSYKAHPVPLASNRYFLSTVTELSKNGTAKKPYKLTYYSPEQLPPRFAYAQDYWGYFNGESKNARLISTDLQFYNENNYSPDINIYAPLTQGDLFHQLLKGTVKNGISSNRKANGAFGIKGILKNIIYPTGGYTQLIYEPHSYFGGDFTPSDTENIGISFGTPDTAGGPKTKSSDKFTSPFNQQAFIIDADANDQDCEDNDYNPDTEGQTKPEVENTGEAELRIKNTTTNQYVDIFYENEQGITVNTGTILNLPEPDGKYYVNLLANHSYELELNILTPCTYGGAELAYKIKPSQTIQTKLDIGGMRIKKIIADDLSNTPKIKEYYYGHGKTLESTTAKDLLRDNSVVFLRPEPAVSYSTNRVHSPTDPTAFLKWIVGKGLECLIGTIPGKDGSGGGVEGCAQGVAESLMTDLMNPDQSFWEVSGIDKLKKREAMCYSVTLGSSTLNPLYTSQGYHVAYTHVTESEGNNFEGGGILHIFDAKLTAPGIRITPYLGFGNPPADCFGCIKNDIVGGTPRSNAFGNGNELNTSIFRKKDKVGFLLLNKTIYNYKLDNRIAGTFINHGVSPRRTYIFVPGQIGQDIFGKKVTQTVEDVNLMEYKLNYHWQYLASTTELQYDQDGKNVMFSTVNYTYDNPTHMQVSSTSTTNSRNEMLITDMVYPDDITNSSDIKGGALTAGQYLALSKLKSYTLHKHVSPVQVSNYEDKNNNGQSEEKELLTRVRTNYKEIGERVLPEFVQAAKGQSRTHYNAALLENRMHYKRYDSFDNLLEASKVDGTVTSYIWAYKGTLPVAKLINVNYASIPTSLITQIETASIADIDQQSDDDLRAALNTLRDEFPDAMIETYTYDPQIGIKTMTDPRGTYIQYQYDEFNRLEYIKDRDGNILKKHTYKVDTY